MLLRIPNKTIFVGVVPEVTADDVINRSLSLLAPCVAPCRLGYKFLSLLMNRQYLTQLPTSIRLIELGREREESLQCK